MDEPTANLDYGNSLRVLEQMRSLADQGYTILFSTHSPDQVFCMLIAFWRCQIKKFWRTARPKVQYPPV